MKKILLFISIVLSTFINSHGQSKVYVNLVSHNEDTYPYLNNPSSYYNARPHYIDFAILCHNKGAVWSMGDEYVFLKAVAQYDTGSVLSTTNNKNLLRWLAEDMEMEVAPHTHGQVYNYTDIAYLFEVLGVVPAPIMSGFIYNTYSPAGQLWMDYQNPVPGDSFPDFQWQPDILWGGGTPGHVDDPEYYGVWKPKDTADFGLHDPNNHLINYAQGCRLVISQMTALQIIAQIDTLITKIQNGEIPQNGFYCTSVFFEDNDLENNALFGRLDSIIDSINVRVANGTMQWGKIVDIINIWQTDYEEQPFHISCDLQDVYTSVQPIYVDDNPISYSKDFIKINNAENYNILIISDISGKILFKTNNLTEKINISTLPTGVYLINLSNNSVIYRKEIIKF